MGLRPQQGLRSKRHLGSVLLSVLFLFTPTAQLLSRAQNPSAPPPASPTSTQELFRLEKVEVAGGAELITIHARLDGLSVPDDQKWTPLVTVLRDTLGR